MTFSDQKKAELQARLFALQDPSYRAFQQKLIPNIPPDEVIGIRTPALRAFAKEYARTPDADLFMGQLPHTYYEENNLHAFLIERITYFSACIAAIDAFLPYVNNWATCDCMSPKVLKKHHSELRTIIDPWLASGETYTVRFGIGLLMGLYLDDDFHPDDLAAVAKIRSDEYYVNMMIAWYFATALAKQYDAALPYLEERRLSEWVHKKTIQKAVESYRITEEQKAYLRSLR